MSQILSILGTKNDIPLANETPLQLRRSSVHFHLSPKFSSYPNKLNISLILERRRLQYWDSISVGERLVVRWGDDSFFYKKVISCKKDFCHHVAVVAEVFGSGFCTKIIKTIDFWGSYIVTKVSSGIFF